VIALILALTVATPQIDLAGNRLEALTQRSDLMKENGPPLLCTTDERWCAEISRDVDSNESELHVFTGLPGGDVILHALTKTDDEDFALWPKIIRLADGALLIGVEHQTSTMYSGGGGSASTLELIRVNPVDPDAAKTVLTLPISASLMIRACFSEQDQYRRRGACHDEYGFGAELTLDPKTTEGPPRLVVEAEATAYPSGSSRDGDSTTRGRLRQRDLVKARDPVCSYRRVMTVDPKTGLYAPDKPAPDCEAFTAP
jgi:hypothetical protein